MTARTPHVLIVGAGMTGATIARSLADDRERVGIRCDVTVVDSRQHVAGNCHTEIDETGALRHVYGPHIFHTSDAEVVKFVNEFSGWQRYEHRVKAYAADGQVYSMPVNLHTIGQLWGRALIAEEAKALVEADRVACDDPKNFEQAALATIGRRLYETFFEGYTTKQWGVHPSALPASTFKRLPVRFDYDDRYFNDTFQAMPVHGYTRFVEQVLDHPGIRVVLGARVDDVRRQTVYDHVVWTGPIDAFFDYEAGDLPYRTLEFKHATLSSQGTSVINYTSKTEAATRTTEHRLLDPRRQGDETATTLTTEYSRAAGREDILYYPMRLRGVEKTIEDYERLAGEVADRVTFAGRLGTFKYMDMAPCIAEALATAPSVALKAHTNRSSK